MNCTRTNAIRRHFAGRLSPAREQEMRAHLPTCGECRSVYDRHLLLNQLSPGASTPKERIARGLGLAPRRVSRPWLVALPCAAAAAILLFLVLPGASDSQPQFVARGSQESSRLLVFRVEQHTEQTQLLVEGDTVNAGDGFAFAVENTSRKSQLLVYGVDEHRHVVWFFPAWEDESETPLSVTIPTTPTRYELPEAIQHQLDGRELSIYGVFSDDVASVRDVERWIAQGKEPAELLEGVVAVTTLRVVQP